MASKAAMRLTVSQRNFIENHVIDGFPVHKAYEKAFRRYYVECKKGVPTIQTLTRLGKKVLKMPEAQEYIHEIKEMLADKSLRKRFLSFDEKRAFLAKVVRTPVGEVDGMHELAQELRVSRDGISVKLPSKLQAIELDARLMGEFKDTVKLEVSEKVIELAEDLK